MLIGSFIPFIGNNAVLFGVVAGIYWAPGLRSLTRKFTRQRSVSTAVAALALLMLTSVSVAQDQPQKPWKETQLFTSFGLSLPTLHSGNELMRSKSLRNNSLSYYEDEAGNRASVGSYPPPIGWAAQIGFYKPVSFANRLLAGASVTASLTGSSPSSGGYEEGYFFNSILIGAAWKYYPLQTGNVSIKGDFGLASVFTKNRFRNSSGQQEFFHQFGIGSGGSAGLSWEFAQNWSIDLTQSFMVTRVEVNGIGDDTWTFGTTNMMIQYRF